MKTIALISGGKDSILSILMAIRHGWEPAVLAHVRPKSGEESEDLNSFMFQTVGSNVAEQIATCCDLPLRIAEVRTGQSKDVSLFYSDHPDQDDEVEVLYTLLKQIKEEFPEVEAVTSGAILSNYQRLRVEAICERIGLKSVAFLWQRNAEEVLDIARQLEVSAILVKTATLGLIPQKHLGKTLEEMHGVLEEIQSTYGSHMAGEGGEYETVVLDCPLFLHQKLQVGSLKVVMVDDNEYSPSGFASLTTTIVEKTEEEKQRAAAILLELRTGSKKFSFPSDSMPNLPLAPVDMQFQTNSKKKIVHHILGDNLEKVFELFDSYLEKVVSSEIFFESFKLSLDAISNVERCQKVFAEIKEKIGDSLSRCFYFIMAVPREGLIEPLTAEYEKMVSHIKPPMRFFFVPKTVTDLGENELKIKALYCDAAQVASVLHAQSYSSWAAGRQGPVSEGWTFKTTLGGVCVVLGGVLGLVPNTCSLAKEEDLTWTSEPKDVLQSTLFAQMNYALNNSSRYLAFFSHSRNDIQNLFMFVPEAYSDYIHEIWHWCVRHYKADVSSMQINIIFVRALEAGAAICINVD